MSSNVDEYGFKREPNFDYASYDDIMTNYYTILTKRRMKWDKYLKTQPNLTNIKSPKLKRYVRKGIPGECFILLNVIFHYPYIFLSQFFTELKFNDTTTKIQN